MTSRIILTLPIVISALLMCGCGSGKPSASSDTNGEISARLPWSVRMAESHMIRQPMSIEYPGTKQKWNYEQGVMYEALRQVYERTKDERYVGYIRKIMDTYVQSDGRIAAYEFDSFNIDNIPMGRALLFLYDRTKDERYRIAADTLRKQLSQHPRTNEGGFWHKKIYPYQMWLDGLYMGQPFYLRYALRSHDTVALNDIVNQFVWMEQHARDTTTGLLYHAWDESKSQRWCDPMTGKSRHFWGRGLGWYAMALVDVIEVFPQSHPRRHELAAILERLAPAILASRDPKSKVWYQILDMPNGQGNYLEASASSMFVYAFAKGARLNLLDERYAAAASESYDGIVKEFITIGEKGMVDLHHTCQGAGLGGNPYRDGSYEYYMSEKQRTNDFKGVGPFIMASAEIERYRCENGRCVCE